MEVQEIKDSDSSTAENWEISVASTLEEIEQIREIWEKLQLGQSMPIIDADIDRYICEAKAKKGEVLPYIITFFRNSEPAAMVVGKIVQQQININMGYKALFKPKLKCLIVTYGGILCEPEREVSELIIRALLKQLKSRKISMIYLNHIRTDSQIFDMSRKMPGFLCRDYIPIIDLHWQTTALENKEAFKKTLSRNERRNISRHTKQLEEKASSRIELKTYRGPANLEEYISTASEISSLTYQKILTGGFNGNNCTRNLLKLAAEKDWLRAYVLYAGSEPVAFESGLLYNSTYFAEYRGYHPDWGCGSPGSILLLKVLEEFSADPDAKIYDYGFGDSPYKQRYGQEHWTEAPVYIFAPRLYPVLVNILRTLIAAVNVFLKYVLKKFGFIDKVKKSWRKRLEQKAINEKKQ